MGAAMRAHVAFRVESRSRLRPRLRGQIANRFGGRVDFNSPIKELGSAPLHAKVEIPMASRSRRPWHRAARAE